MTISAADREALDKRDTLTFAEASIIDHAFRDLHFRASLHGMALAQDDRAAVLEAAMVRFVLESRPAVAE